MGWILPDAPARRTRRDRCLLALGAVLALVLVLRAARKQDSVLDRNQEWGARFVAREDPYVDVLRGGRLHGPYPPSYALVCAPLSLLPTGVARVAWALAQVGALTATFVLVRRWLRRGWPELAPHAGVLYAIALVLGARFVLRDMAGGGGNLLYATGALWGIELALSGRALPAGLLMALPVALKPNLALLLLALPLRARWRAFACALASIAMLAWLPAAWFGAEGWWELWRRWAQDVVAFARVEDLASAAHVPAGFPVDAHGMNQSLRAAIGRAAGTLHGWSRAADVAGTAAAVAAAAWACRRARGPRAEILGALALLPALLLASPIAWKAHHALLLALFALLAAQALERRRFGALAAFLGVYWSACGLLGQEIAGDAVRDALQSASVLTWFTLALLAVTVASARGADADARPGAAPA